MNFLMKYLDEEEMNQIYDTYEPWLLTTINEENFTNIIRYLKENQIDYIKDIIIYYLDLFLLEYPRFVSKFECIKKELGTHYQEIIGDNLNILESMIK